ncbi:MAG: TrpR YerC/YecD [Actinomycetes bacterium]|jgi:TrpR-related protein YerC/YecD|nr:TrpR YerC/YecD [Actinomycetes bacterium]
MGIEKIRTKEVEQLMDAFLKMENKDELFSFLVDVCTIREMEEISQRLEVARQLANKTPYAEIQKATGASATTIARVSKCLNYGEGAYPLVLERLGLIGK